MLLDLDAATLTIFVNGERKGVMVQPGMTVGIGPGGRTRKTVTRLEGPLRWAADLRPGESVAIAGPLPPPAEVA